MKEGANIEAKVKLIDNFNNIINSIVDNYWGGVLLILFGIYSLRTSVKDWENNYNSFTLGMFAYGIVFIVLGLYLIILKLIEI
jgi:hypothetical protein